MPVITQPVPFFADLDGSPLDNGRVYFGTAGGNPVTSPVAVYWDEAETQPVAQPAQTMNGMIYRSGTPAAVYASVPLSVLVQNSAGAQILYAASVPTIDSTLRADLAASSGSSLVGFLQSGTGATARTLQARGRDTIHSPDFSSVDAAVSDVNTNGGDLWFPRGTTAAASSIPNFHAVRKNGPGAITRGSDTFYIEPTRSQTNRIYVSATGSTANDGLTSAQPTTLAQAMTILGSYGPTLSGTWRIVLAAGTYGGLIDFPEGLRGDFAVVIEGPTVNHPNVPTAILDGTSSQAYGLNLGGGAQRVTVSNIRFINFTAYGVVGQDLADLTTVNVHGSGITSAADAAAIKLQQGRLRVQGGIISGCRYGVIAIGGTVFTIGDGATNLATGTQFSGCTEAGVLAQDGATGHTDFCTMDNCVVGVDGATNAKVNIIGCDIKNNTTAGVRASSGAQVLVDGATVYTGNAINEVVRSKGGEINRQVTWVDVSRSNVDTSVATHTGTTPTNIRTFVNAITAGSFTWPGRSLTLEATGGIANSGAPGTKTLTLRIGTTDVVSAVIPAAGFGGFRVRARLQAVDATNQRATIEVSVNGQPDLVTVANATINMASAYDVHLRCTLAVALDQIQPTWTELWQTA